MKIESKGIQKSSGDVRVQSFLHLLSKGFPSALLMTIIILMIFIYQSIAKQKFNQIDFLINHTHFIKKLICKYYSLKFAIYYNELLIQHYDTTSIIETLYDKITDSDIKMIVYELYRLIVNGHDFNLAVN